jgi:hypothetical protein
VRGALSNLPFGGRKQNCPEIRLTLQQYTGFALSPGTLCCKSADIAGFAVFVEKLQHCGTAGYGLLSRGSRYA